MAPRRPYDGAILRAFENGKMFCPFDLFRLPKLKGILKIACGIEIAKWIKTYAVAFYESAFVRGSNVPEAVKFQIY